MRRFKSALALGTGLLAMAVSVTAMAATDQRALFTPVQNHSDHSILTFVNDITDREQSNTLSGFVALPPNAVALSASVLEGPAGASVRVLGIKGHMRGLPLAAVELTCSDPGLVRVELRHDGDWNVGTDDRLRRHSRSFDALLGVPMVGGDREFIESENGCYLIITSQEFLDAAQPLVEWKRRKGFHVEIETIEDIEAYQNSDIQAYIRNAYETWDIPPEYLLLLGDIDTIPNFLMGPNGSDLAYSLMDDEDWYPDLLIGRISVETSFEAETMINKTVAYEREPYTDDMNWFNRYLPVAANYSSSSPVTMVKFCGEMLQSIGMENGYHVNPEYWDPPLDPMIADAYQSIGGVYYLPFQGAENSVPLINGSLDRGASIVMYRGWAQFIDGWLAPWYVSENIGSLRNGAMNHVVMSFVCETGDYTFNRACMGEVWLRSGTPVEPRGAVAFVGNTVGWSHTINNDAMALAFFERIVDPAVTDMAQLMLAGRMRYAEYFPQLQDFADHDTESVEFYVGVYNLLGEPELNFHKAVPTELTVSHDATIDAGANFIEVSVMEADGVTPAEGARVGLVQGDALLGCGFADFEGSAQILLGEISTGTDIDVTVTMPARLPYEGAIGTGNSGSFVTLDSYSTDDSAGNGDGVINPGETLLITATMRNTGDTGATDIEAILGGDGPLTITQNSSLVDNLPAGASAICDQAFELTINDAIEDGQRVFLSLQAQHNAVTDMSTLVLDIVAPALTPSAFSIGGDGYLAVGGSSELVITLENLGHLDASNIEAELVLNDGTLGSVTNNFVQFTDAAVGESCGNAAMPFVIALNGNVPAGRVVPLTLNISTDEYETAVAFTLVAGLVNPAAPSGPDNYGYYAYDSSDLLYTQRPEFIWREISTEFGGDGAKLNYIDNDDLLTIDLPFDFSYYGQTFPAMSLLTVSDDGWISFEQKSDQHEQYSFYNWDIPNPHGFHSIIAPFWDNFNPEVGSGPGDDYKDGVYWKYDATEHALIVEWSRMRHYKEELGDLQSFQLVLFDPAFTGGGDGIIEFHYRQVNNNDHLRNFATIGIESPDETDGLELSYASIYAEGMSPVGPGLAIRLTSEAPVYAPIALGGFNAEPVDAGLQLSWSSDDERPILGWRLTRVENGREIQVGDVLPSWSRSYLDTEADPSENREYYLTALLPYGQESKLGPWFSYADYGTSLRLSLFQNLPNPMQGSSRIDYVLPKAAQLSLKIYDLNGRLVRSLIDGHLSAGPGSAIWDGRDGGGRTVATGVYFYRLETGGRTMTRKLMLVR